MKRWLQGRLVDPLLALLQQGISPNRLALCVAIGVVVGNIPIFGTSTILCVVIALTFRLNLPAMQLVQAAMAPSQVLLIIPFVRLGEALLGASHQPLAVPADLALVAHGAGHAVIGLWDVIVRAGFAWLLVAPFATWLLYKLLAPAFQRAAAQITARRQDEHP